MIIKSKNLVQVANIDLSKMPTKDAGAPVATYSQGEINKMMDYLINSLNQIHRTMGEKHSDVVNQLNAYFQTFMDLRENRALQEDLNPCDIPHTCSAGEKIKDIKIEVK